MVLQYSDSVRNAKLDAVETAIGVEPDDDEDDVEFLILVLAA